MENTGHSRRLFWTVILTVSAECMYSLPINTLPRSKLTVPVGGDVTFSCDATENGDQWVRWDRVDTGDIVAMETHIIIPDPRVSVSLWDNNTWTLSITNVQKEDDGTYRCEVNSNPSSMHDVYLEVLEIPEAPTIVMSSMDTSVQEGSTLILVCQVKGYPKPVVTWTRDDRNPISVASSNDISMGKIKETFYVGELLKLTDITRDEAGPYRCTANNSISPEATEKIQIKVTFKPEIIVPSPVLVVPLGSEVKLNCTVNTSPMAITYWSRNSGHSGMIIVGEEYVVRERHDDTGTVNMTLIIKEFHRHLSGAYYCVAKNEHGRLEGKVEVYDLFNPEFERSLFSTKRNYSREIEDRKEPEKKYIAIDINPKRGQENLADGSRNNDKEKSARLRPGYYSLLSFLRFFGLLMSFY